MRVVQGPVQLAKFLDAVSREAVSRHGVPASLAASASAVALRKFRAGGRWDGTEANRVRAYYWGVVRRHALGPGAELAGLRLRYVAATVAADMLEGGHAPERVDDAILARFGTAPLCDGRLAV